jgi:hypothetical protein
MRLRLVRDQHDVLAKAATVGDPNELAILRVEHRRIGKKDIFPDVQTLRTEPIQPPLRARHAELGIRRGHEPVNLVEYPHNPNIHLAIDFQQD